MSQLFRRGQSIAWRVRLRVRGSQVDSPGFVSAATVVRDAPLEVAVMVRPGYPGRRRNARLGGSHALRHRPVIDWLPGWTPEVWSHEWRILTFKRLQDQHSISLAWRDATDEFDHWYVDLTSPAKRSGLGFDLVEHGLDAWLDRDMQTLNWKDEDELAWAVEHGTYSPEEAAALYAEGERAAERLRRERSRFEEWIRWRPDPVWSAPSLPAGWDSQ